MAQKESRDALQMLADDHRTVEALFEKYDNARGEAAQQKIVQQICQELTIHAMVEEQVFYPAIREAVDDDMMDEAQVEHDSAKTLILSLQQGTPSDAYYDAKVSVLKEQVEHHVYEEERQRGSIFAQVRKAEIDLVALGGQMAELKQRLLAQAKAEGLPRPELVALAS
ncbi:MAG: hemerythrin [Sphingomonadales bacterium RIFCSPHIGHO2_01_FULL_65_20]|jgi:hemerythrin superfamily protein|uniref:hemerythrin domain-containing protein n=1 Tax=unclassified Blastomonas TaxID=2626550 RepID=UPI00083337AC|nr:hemerythrin domain-containing protein [Blastomonas sp.]OHC93152.1 MAG: hemerythrin [Sphingomonadales bacterium RIFCSPHIGHO2_01_FULL_65_20]